jgi:hypothetical protein
MITRLGSFIVLIVHFKGECIIVVAVFTAAGLDIIKTPS